MYSCLSLMKIMTCTLTEHVFQVFCTLCQRLCLIPSNLWQKYSISDRKQEDKMKSTKYWRWHCNFKLFYLLMVFPALKSQGILMGCFPYHHCVWSVSFHSLGWTCYDTSVITVLRESFYSLAWKLYVNNWSLKYLANWE